MKMEAFKKNIAGVLSMMLIFPINVVAQKSIEFTLNESIEHALDHSYLKRKILLEQIISEKDQKIIKSKFLPQVNAYAKYMQYLEVPTYIFPAAEGSVLSGGGTSGPYPLEIGEEFNLFSGLRIDQVLFDRSWLDASEYLQRSDKVKKLKLEEVEKEIIFNVASNFYKIDLRNKQLQALDSSILIIKNLQNVMQLQYENDLINQTEVDRIRLQVIKMNRERKKLATGIEQQLMLMKFLLGMPFEDNLNLVFEETDIVVEEEMPEIESYLQSQLLTQQKELLLLKKNNIRSKYFLNIKAYADFQIQAQRDNFSFFDSNEEWFGAHVIGLNFNFPIFNGMAKTSKLEKSEVELSLLDLNFEQNKIKLKMEYHQALKELENSLIYVDQQKENKDLAERVYKNILLQYKEGVTPLYELLNTESIYRESVTSYQSALLDIKMAKLQLLKATDNLRTFFKKE